MARGFGAGLLHGALAGAALLVGASLLLPSPEPAGEKRDTNAPVAGVIGTPAGSEFGRGVDSQPSQPAALESPAPRPSLSTVPEPESDPLPAATSPAAERPATRAQDPAAFGSDVEADDLNGVSGLDLGETPQLRPAPDRFAMPGLDRGPSTPPSPDAPPARGHSSNGAETHQADSAPQITTDEAPSPVELPKLPAAEIAQETVPEPPQAAATDEDAGTDEDVGTGPATPEDTPADADQAHDTTTRPGDLPAPELFLPPDLNGLAAHTE